MKLAQGAPVARRASVSRLRLARSRGLGANTGYLRPTARRRAGRAANRGRGAGASDHAGQVLRRIHDLEEEIAWLCEIVEELDRRQSDRRECDRR